MTRRIGVVVFACLIIILASQFAQATEYSNESKHYSLTVPDSWTQETIAGVDVSFVHSSGANINVVSVTEYSARNDASWLLQQAQLGLEELKDQFGNLITVQSPRSFNTGSGRAAADYIIDYTYFSSSLRVRQVIFASDYWNMAYVLTLTAQQDEYSTHNSVWNEAVDTFTIVGEGSTGISGLLLAIIIGAVIGGIAGGVGYAVYRSKKKKAEEVSQQSFEAQYQPGAYETGQPSYETTTATSEDVQAEEPAGIDKKE